MRRFRLIPLLIAAAMLASGCGMNAEVERQAYALMLGIDRLESGDIELTLRVPRIEGAAPEAGSGSDAETYLVVSAAGAGYAQAMSSLQWQVERVLNLSQLKLIVASEALASDAAFREILDEVALTRHLYTTADFVVCEGTARAFVAAPDAMLGSRMSSEIASVFAHYAARGLISKSPFADLFYDTHADYSDPVGIWGYTGSGRTGPGDSVAIDGSEGSDGDDAEAAPETARHYLGTAVFRDGRLATRLGAEETLYLSLLTRTIKGFTLLSEGRAYSLASAGRPQSSVRVDGDEVGISVRVRLSLESPADGTAAAALTRDLESRLAGFIKACQQRAIEPFGFARKAARSFLTLDAWRAYGWRAHFQNAAVTVRVDVTGQAS